MKTLVYFFLVVAFVCQYNGANSQINLKDKIKNQTNNRANQRTDQGIDKGLDKIENGIKGMFKKKDGQDSTQNQQEQNVNENATDVKAESTGKSQANEPQLQAYSKYDFVPGEKVIFYEDFSQDAVGDFPALWNTNGSAEVVTTNLFPGNWMKFVMDQCVWTDNLLDLPENYTIEFDVIPQGGLEGAGMSGWHLRLMQAKNVKAWDSGSAPGNGGFHFTVEYFGRPSYNTWLMDDCSSQNLSGYVEQEEFKEKINQKYHIAIWVQKTRVRLYQNENKIIDLPRAFPAGCVKPDRLRFEAGAALISNIRIAVGAPDTRNKLITEGKLVTYGIYFDVNKDVVKPESYGTLKEIATILN